MDILNMLPQIGLVTTNFATHRTFERSQIVIRRNNILIQK